MIVSAKKLNPNKLPFLQAQMLQKNYQDLYEDATSDMATLAEIADYPTDSKILYDAMKALVTKGLVL